MKILESVTATLSVKSKYLFFVSYIIVYILCAQRSFCQVTYDTDAMVVKNSKDESVELSKHINAVYKIIKDGNFYAFKEISLSSVYCHVIGDSLPGITKKPKLLKIEIFIDSILKRYFVKNLVNNLKDTPLLFLKIRYPYWNPENIKLRRNEPLVLYEGSLYEIYTDEYKVKYRNDFVFKFIKINGHFKLFELQFEISNPRGFLNFN